VLHYERKEILGVPCEEGGFLTEASLQEGNPVEPTEEVTDRFMALDRKTDTAPLSTEPTSQFPSVYAVAAVKGYAPPRVCPAR
jgi:hypothetical protein